MRKRFDAIIFDMDGVLVDESKSYRLAIEMTVNSFLSKNEASSNTNQEEIRLIKSIPKFNNDWDVSFVLVELLQKGIKKEKFLDKVKPVTGRIRKKEKYLEIKDIFQSYYLGENLFRKIYYRMPPLRVKTGLINNDRLLPDEELLKMLYQLYKFGVVTSRPRFEAIYGLKNLQIMPKFIEENQVIAKEDCPKEKPAPDPILLIIERMRYINPIYIGDTINDTIAAYKAGIPCIFIGDKNLGDFQVKNVKGIKEILL